MILPWHQAAFDKLNQMVENNHLPHALLITGAEGIGKLGLVQSFIKTLVPNAQRIDQDFIEQELDTPTLIRRSNYENLIYCRSGEINDKTKNRSKEIRIDQVRAFCDALNKTADDLQIGVLFYADQMNIAAANALLKTLEEPRENTLIILLAHSSETLPITVVSRCQTVHIPPSYTQQTQDWIAQQIPPEQTLDFDIARLLENAHGVPSKVLDELSTDTYKTYQAWQNQLLSIAIHPSQITNQKAFDGYEVEVLKCLQNLLIEAIRLSSLKQDSGLLELNQITKQVRSEFLFKLLDDVYHAISLAKTSVNIKLLLDNVLTVWSHITHLKQYPKITGEH